jgi:hypothetical protein
MRGKRRVCWGGLLLVGAGTAIVAGCYITPINPYKYYSGPAPLRGSSPDHAGADCCYEDSLTGGHIFEMYCGACHNIRSLAERPFSNYKNVAAHMRVRANLTGKEYAELVAWMRRWADVPPPNPPLEPSPKRFIFSQPIPELREKGAAKADQQRAQQGAPDAAPDAPPATLPALAPDPAARPDGNP